MASIGRVLVVDDHPLFRGGLASLLQSHGVDVVGEAADGLEAIVIALERRPDIVLMDVCMPRCGGIEAARRITSELPSTRVIMLTVSDSDGDLFAAIEAGAAGYLLKSVAPDELLRLLHGIADGEAPVSGAMASRLLNQFATHRPRPAVRSASGPGHTLTDRELEVLRAMVAGASNREVGNHLAISENTVKNHLRRIMEKLHVDNRVQLVAWAIRNRQVRDDNTLSDSHQSSAQ
ncbi:MAG: response regulator [Chloroflexota bacterium]